MVEYKRLAGYIFDYFPEPIYSSQDVRDWAEESVPAWSHIKKSEQDRIIGDWENFIAPEFESRLRGMSRRFITRIKNFLGRLF